MGFLLADGWPWPVSGVRHRLDPLHVQEVRVDREMISPGWAAPPDLAGIGFETK